MWNGRRIGSWQVLGYVTKRQVHSTLGWEPSGSDPADSHSILYFSCDPCQLVCHLGSWTINRL